MQQLEQQVSQTQAQIAQTKTQVGSARADLQQLAIQNYTSGNSNDDLEQLFAPGGERAAAVQEYQQVASESVSGAIDRLNQSESELSAQQSALETTQSQARSHPRRRAERQAGRAVRARQPAGDAFEAQRAHRHIGGSTPGGAGGRAGCGLPGTPRRVAPIH